ncbi:hypothetical protein [Salinarimonas rosea]|uniref:hypothetical protein n=1 Tax=Salinarimonas rosea TaxID=552063 RepID=UPI000404B611|nr:hypothetical protein [Salinarimonas rosea]
MTALAEAPSPAASSREARAMFADRQRQRLDFVAENAAMLRTYAEVLERLAAAGDRLGATHATNEATRRLRVIRETMAEAAEDAAEIGATTGADPR